MGLHIWHSLGHLAPQRRDSSILKNAWIRRMVSGMANLLGSAYKLRVAVISSFTHEAAPNLIWSGYSFPRTGKSRREWKGRGARLSAIIPWLYTLVSGFSGETSTKSIGQATGGASGMTRACDIFSVFEMP